MCIVSGIAALYNAVCVGVSCLLVTGLKVRTISNKALLSEDEIVTVLHT